MYGIMDGATAARELSSSNSRYDTIRYESINLTLPKKVIKRYITKSDELNNPKYPNKDSRSDVSIHGGASFTELNMR